MRLAVVTLNLGAATEGYRQGSPAPLPHLRREEVISMKSRESRPRRRIRWADLERVIQLVALLVTALATLVTAIQGAGPA